jgi:hypothetical protein
MCVPTEDLDRGAWTKGPDCAVNQAECTCRAARPNGIVTDDKEYINGLRKIDGI